MTFNNDNSPVVDQAQDADVSTENELREEVENDPMELVGPIENDRISSWKLSGKLEIFLHSWTSI